MIVFHGLHSVDPCNISIKFTADMFRPFPRSAAVKRNACHWSCKRHRRMLCHTRFATGTQNGGLAIRNPRESGECFANVGRCHLTMFAESDDGIMYHAIQLALEDFVVPFGQSFRIDKKQRGIDMGRGWIVFQPVFFSRAPMKPWEELSENQSWTSPLKPAPHQA